MSEYLGTVGKRLTAEVTLTRNYTFEAESFSRWGGYETKHIYTMTDDDGNVLVWKTTALMGVDEECDENRERICWYSIRKGDRIKVTGTVKEHSEYKGERQTVLQRVRVVEVIQKSKTYEQYRDEKQAEQLATMKGEDFIWHHMPYKQYKEHYSDCETFYGSFIRDEHTNEPFVDVIIREGRLKKSGVRGEVFSDYVVTSESGFSVTYKAVCEENAVRRAEKEYPNETGWYCEESVRKPYEPWGSHSFWSN